MLKLYPYKIGSKSCRLLAQELGIKRIRPEGKYVPKGRVTMLNWGNSTTPKWHSYCGWLNHPNSVRNAANKLTTFRLLADANIQTVEFTAELAIAKGWLDKGNTVVARRLLTGHSGNGIVLISPKDSMVAAPLYTLYKKKAAEFRVHVFDGRVFDIQHKRKRHEQEVNYQIRNYLNGWVYCRDNIVLPDHIKEIAISSVQALSLDFGAVDIIWNKQENRCYVLEINTAPGLEGTTLTNYVERFSHVK